MDFCSRSKTLPQLGGVPAVAGEAEGLEVGEVALASAFGYGEDVVGVPEGLAGRGGFEAVEAEAGLAFGSAGSFEGGEDGEGVGLAEGADAVISQKDLLAEVSGVGAELPLVDAEAGAEGAAAAGEDFELTPAAEGTSVGSGGTGLAMVLAAGFGESAGGAGVDAGGHWTGSA